MSNDYFAWNERQTRKREVARQPLQELPVLADEPIEVKEDPLSETGVVRFLRRIAGIKT